MPSDFEDKKYNTKKALVKAASFCAYQERCHQEVVDKLESWNLSSEEVDEVMAALYADKFIDNQRFAKSYCRGKFYYNKWGRIRIQLELRKKGISALQIATGLQEISENDYRECLSNLAHDKWSAAKAPDDYQKRAKVYRFLQQKGFESHLIAEVLEELR